MFWLLAILLTLVAAIFLALPLLRLAPDAGPTSARRDALNMALYEEAFAELEQQRRQGALSQTQFQERERELSHRLVADADAGEETAVASEAGRVGPSMVVALLLLLPIGAWLLYQQLGSWEAWRLTQRVEQITRSTEPVEAPRLMALLGDLGRFNQGREEVDWLFLQAQTAMQVGAYPAAAASFERALLTQPGNADLLAWRVQALYLARGRQLDDELNALIDQTLTINPHQSTVLGIRGMHAFERGDFALAAEAWGRALAGLPPGSPSALMMQRGIQQANAALASAAGAPGSMVAAPAEQAGAPAAGAADGFSKGIKVRVELASRVQVAPGSTVFVIASAPEGGMPFAVVRLPVEGLPAEVVLDDSTAMAPGRSLSRQHQVKVTARVSRSGNAIGQTGDWQGRSVVMTPATLPPVVAIRIDQQI